VIHWAWGLTQAVMVTAVIWMNGRGWRSGWAVGVLVQLFWVAFGITYGAPTFWFSLIPAAAFAYNWWQHPKRSAQVGNEFGPYPSMELRVPDVLSQEEYDRFRARWIAKHGATPATQEGDSDDR
jgi:hypothetical protein